MLIGEDIVVSDEKERNDCNAASAFLPVLLEGAFLTVKITLDYIRLTCVLRNVSESGRGRHEIQARRQALSALFTE